MNDVVCYRIQLPQPPTETASTPSTRPGSVLPPSSTDTSSNVKNTRSRPFTANQRPVRHHQSRSVSPRPSPLSLNTVTRRQKQKSSESGTDDDYDDDDFNDDDDDDDNV